MLGVEANGLKIKGILSSQYIDRVLKDEIWYQDYKLFQDKKMF